MMLMAKLLALAICVFLFYETTAQVEVGFEQADYTVREGRDGEFFLRLYIGDLANDVVLRLRPLTVSGFENYRNDNPSRTFAQSILDDVAAISNPAEYEQEPGSRRDFNSSVFSIVFPFSVDEVEVEVTKSLVFDDDVNEVNEEGFVIVLEIEQSNPADSVTLNEGRDVLVFYIRDNDVVTIGFQESMYTVIEQDDVEVCVGVLRGILAPGVSFAFNVQTVDGSAFGTSDYETLMVNGTLSEGNIQACYDIATEGDDMIEPQELFYVSLILFPGPIENLVSVSPNFSSVLIIDNNTNITIQDNDGGAVTVAIATLVVKSIEVSFMALLCMFYILKKEPTSRKGPDRETNATWCRLVATWCLLVTLGIIAIPAIIAMIIAWPITISYLFSKTLK